MTQHYRLSESAESDIINIIRYTLETWGPKKAREYGSLLHDKMNFIAQNQKLSQSRSSIKTGYFSYGIGSHMLFFIPESQTTINVLRVLHARMDPELHL